MAVSGANGQRRSRAEDAGLQPGREPAAGGGLHGLLGLPGGGGGEGGQRGEGGHLDHPGDDSRGGADLLEPEQADPHRQQVPAEGGQGEPGACRGDEPTAGREHGRGQAEGRDHLEQEQPAEGGDRPVAGQVQVQVDRPGRGQQPGAGQPQPGPLGRPGGRPAARCHVPPPCGPGPGPARIGFLARHGFTCRSARSPGRRSAASRGRACCRPAARSACGWTRASAPRWRPGSCSRSSSPSCRRWRCRG